MDLPDGFYICHFWSYLAQIVGKLILSRTMIFPGNVINVVSWVLMGLTTLACGHLLRAFETLDGRTSILLIEGSLAIFGVQAFFEMVEKFISMFSNTLSYVRVGAFAIVHAGFTGAVFVIAQLVSGGAEAGFGYWAVVVLGNLFVIGLEGFIVFIQTMRLHYYEFFSKFFQGGGSPYEPLALATAQRKVTELLSEQYSIIQKEKKDDQNCYCDTGNSNTSGSLCYVFCEPAQQ